METDLARRMLIEEAAVHTRREFLNTTASGLGMMALGAMLTQDGLLSPAHAMPEGGPGARQVEPLESRPPHFEPRAKSCIFIFMEGAPSQIDLFDPKPKLRDLHGQKLPPSMLEKVRFAFIQKDTAFLMASRRAFERHGKCGMEISDYLPHIASTADDLCLIRSLHTDQFNHHPGQLLMQCGAPRFGLPSMGSWVTYGLGSESRDLPGYVVLTSGRGGSGGATLWTSGFMPSVHSGVLFFGKGDPVLDLANPPGLPARLQRKGLDVLREANRSRYEEIRDPEISSRIASYELAYRMQTAAPELMDLSGERQQTLEMYGADREDVDAKDQRGSGGPGTFASFARNCLLARRLVERGVRFVNIIFASWDHHNDIDRQLRFNCRCADQPIAALIKDLKERGLLDQTLVVWGSEFGRTPLAENRKGDSSPNTGRDHHPFAFSMFLAGGGFRGGLTYGETDEIGWNIVKDPMHVNDLHATILHTFGLDHLKLTYRFQGRDFRLTDVGG
ncbi:MAG TPA: DUF1501 domain-containing protein, partial [Planctomycetota bacterium]|nr:DUF1501 domain-containing protein [Planctomycetota bacterium]